MNLYGLIGYPLTHSFSQQYFTQKFEREGIMDCIYKNFPITSINEFPALLKANFLKGLNVTIPYKEQVLQYVTSLSDDVKIIGAANTIIISGDNLFAYNTDVIGFEKSFTNLIKPDHKRALVLGTGGASKAVQFVLKKLDIEYLLVSRSDSANGNLINYDQLTRVIMKQYPVIINCTPSGMSPADNNCPDIPYHFITPDHYVFDLIYKPAKTLLLKKAEEQGAAIKNGYDMLIIQAEESWKLWNTHS
ncbi:MAG: shikimate dehydrogenase [Ginsengibacter sp.]